MKKLFLIAPYQVDADYIRKKRIINEFCNYLNIILLIAENSNTRNSLDAKETVTLLNDCDFAIADLSYERPSCYYEVGYLQALNKKVWLICKFGSALHQVLHLENMLTYSDLETYSSVIDKILKNETYGS